MGTMNFGLFPMLKRFTEFKHDWELRVLEVFARYRVQEHHDIEHILRTLSESGTRFEFGML